MAAGWHFGDLGHFLEDMWSTIGAGHGTPDDAKWASHRGGTTVYLESRMPDWRALAM